MSYQSWEDFVPGESDNAPPGDPIGSPGPPPEQSAGGGPDTAAGQRDWSDFFGAAASEHAPEPAAETPTTTDTGTTTRRPATEGSWSDYIPGIPEAYAPLTGTDARLTPPEQEIGQPGPPPQVVQEPIGREGPAPIPEDELPREAGTDNRSWFQRIGDIGRAARDEVGDLAGMGPGVLRNLYQAGQKDLFGGNPDPLQFAKDVVRRDFGTVAGTIGNTVNDAVEVSKRTMGGLAAYGNDLAEGNWGELRNYVNPINNLYYEVTGDQPPGMTNLDYNTRNVLARNYLGAVLPGSGGGGAGTPIIPENIPVVGGDTQYDIPILGGVLRAGQAVVGGVTGAAQGQGPSIDFDALRNDLSNGMPIATPW